MYQGQARRICNASVKGSIPLRSTKFKNEENMYLGNFDNKESLMANFEITENDLDGCRILFAAYENESYEGYAMVIFSKNGKLYEVNGSHCSCYGLEGQWIPEETSLEALKIRNYSHGSLQCDLSKFLVDFIFEEDILKS